jgi:hypothetical protein
MKSDTQETVKSLDRRLMATGTGLLGLASGKMGHCLYFYHKSRITGNSEYERFAEKLINEILENIDSVKNCDIKSGLSGIGLSFNYLIDREYIRGNSNELLKDIDVELFRLLCKTEPADFETLPDMLYYFTVRLEKQKRGSENEWLFREVIIQGVNDACERIALSFFEETLQFSLENPLFRLLYVFSRCLEIHGAKIRKTLKELTPHIVSKIPYLHSCRLFMLWVMRLINSKLQNSDWERHIRMIKENMDIHSILEDEMKGRDIYFSCGLPAVYFLLSQTANCFSDSELQSYYHSIFEKITVSEEWERLEKDENYFKTKTGLYSGYCGTALLLNQSAKP